MQKMLQLDNSACSSMQQQVVLQNRLQFSTDKTLIPPSDNGTFNLTHLKPDQLQLEMKDR